MFPFSVVWSRFNDWFDDTGTASHVSTLRKNWRRLQRYSLSFARQMTFGFFKVFFEHTVFPQENWEGKYEVCKGEYEESLFIPHGHKLGCSSLLMVSWKWSGAPFTQGLWKLQHLTRMRAESVPSAISAWGTWLFKTVPSIHCMSLLWASSLFSW